jgi:L-lactate dehydrogenase
MSNLDVAIITNTAHFAGPARLEELAANAPLFRELIPRVVDRSPDAILVIITNPVDAMTYLAIKHSGLPATRVIGTGTLIDTMRFRAVLAREWRINPLDVRAYILGEHGDSQFAALSVATAGGVKLDPNDPFVWHAFESTRGAGRYMIERKGYTNFAVASSAAMIVKAIREDSRTVLPVSTLIDGYLGVRDVCLSVPCVVGASGVLRTLPVDLDAREADCFRRSARVLREALDSVGA